MKRSENLYRIIRDKNNISLKLAILIRDTYPQISRDWLLYGMGEMEEKPLYNKTEFIPYFEKSQFEPIFNLLIPIFDAEKARRMTDAAMSPMIPKDALVAIKMQTPESIVYGKIYLIQTENLSVVRIVRKSEPSDNKLILKAINCKHYDDIIINRNDIINLHLVTGVVSKLS